MQHRQHPNIIKRQNREVAVLLVLLGLYGLYKQIIGVEVSTTLIGAIALAAIIKPGLFNPIRKVWFGLGLILGAISSRVILTAAYFLVLMPVSLLKRSHFEKKFYLNEFKKSQDSVFQKNSQQNTREICEEHSRTFNREDIIHPY